MVYQGTAVTIPAIEIKYFALSTNVQRLLYSQEEWHYYFSDMLLGMVMFKCSEISEKVIGAKYITLYSVPRGKKLYERLGFREFIDDMNRNKIMFLDGCTPMFIEIA